MTESTAEAATATATQLRLDGGAARRKYGTGGCSSAIDDRSEWAGGRVSDGWTKKRGRLGFSSLLCRCRCCCSHAAHPHALTHEQPQRCAQHQLDRHHVFIGVRAHARAACRRGSNEGATPHTPHAQTYLGSTQAGCRREEEEGCMRFSQGGSARAQRVDRRGLYAQRSRSSLPPLLPAYAWSLCCRRRIASSSTSRSSSRWMR